MIDAYRRTVATTMLAGYGALVRLGLRGGGARQGPSLRG